MLVSGKPVAETKQDRVPFALPDITEAEVEAVARVVRSGWVTSGPEMTAFEDEFAEYQGGTVEAVAVNSATAGLHLALEACGIGPGDEVIVPTWTFTATAEVVRYLGARPVLVDVNPITLNIDLKSVEEALYPATRAVIPVHLAGLGVNIGELREIVGRDVRIVEDAAHAIPTISNGLRVGACQNSDVSVFSFYATKTMTTGEGGMITTRDPEIASRCRVMRLHGIDRDAFDRYRSDKPAWFYDVVAAGYKYNMPDTAAALGRVQLRRSDEMHQRRSALAEQYMEQLAGLPLEIPSAAPVGDTHAWHLFIVRLAADTAIARDEFIGRMSDAGVGTSVHFIPLHLHSYWRDSLGLRREAYPIANDQFKRVVSLPLFSSMSEHALTRVIDTVREILL